MLELIDTHADLDDEKFAADLPDVLRRAEAAGIRRIVTIATTAASSAAAVTLAERHPLLAATVGLQPNNLAEEKPTAWDEVLALAGRPQVVGLGETGLDRHWNFTPFPQQEDYFARHLQLAQERTLPVVIHCREAEADVVRMLRDDFDRHGPVSGVMHSFTGDRVTAEACLAMGLFLSFAGMVTYKNARKPARCGEGRAAGSSADRDGQPLSGAGPAAWQAQRAGLRGAYGDLPGEREGGVTGGAGERGGDECPAVVYLAVRVGDRVLDLPFRVLGDRGSR